MECAFCESSNTYELKKKTKLGYRQYHCRDCISQYNERSGTPYNFLHYPTDVVLLVVFYYYHFKSSLVDVTEHMALRGFSISHETVRLWSQQFGTEIGLQLRARRRGAVGKKWHMDITYLWVESRWCYCYRAIDKEGNLVDVYLSETRDKKAAEAFFKSCESTTSITPDQITTDKEKAFPAAIKRALGAEVKHRDDQYLNNVMEQHHRGIKSRCAPMKGFKDFFCALNFCYVFEEIQQFFRVNQHPLSKRRGLITSKFQEFKNIMMAAA
jgi:transposase-like protein